MSRRPRLIWRAAQVGVGLSDPPWELCAGLGPHLLDVLHCLYRRYGRDALADGIKAGLYARGDDDASVLGHVDALHRTKAGFAQERAALSTMSVQRGYGWVRDEGLAKKPAPEQPEAGDPAAPKDKHMSMAANGMGDDAKAAGSSFEWQVMRDYPEFIEMCARPVSFQSRL